jgi:hypothetical protein
LSGENKRWSETIKKMEVTGGKLVSSKCFAWHQAVVDVVWPPCPSPAFAQMSLWLL